MSVAGAHLNCGVAEDSDDLEGCCPAFGQSRRRRVAKIVKGQIINLRITAGSPEWTLKGNVRFKDALAICALPER